MTEFTRVTVLGSTQKAELVIPSEEPIGGLLPRLVQLLSEPTGRASQPLRLVRGTGEQLDVTLSALEQQVRDGESLRLVRAAAAPPPPQVADVTDVLGETLTDRQGRWNDRTRRGAGLVAVGLLGTMIATFNPAGIPVQVGAAVALLLAAVLLGRLGAQWVGAACVAMLLGALPLLVTRTLPELVGGPVPIEQSTAAIVMVGWLVIVVGVGLGRRNRAAGWAGGLGAVLAAIPLIATAFGAPALGAAAITGTVAALAAGLLPRYALMASGLTGVDDAVSTGGPRLRHQVDRSVDDAYLALNWAAYAIAVPVALTTGQLIASANSWAVWIGFAVLISVALRGRALPLALAKYAFWGAVLVGGLTGVVRLAPLNGWPLIAVLAGVTGVIAAAVLVRPAEHSRAGLRRVGNVIESIATIVLIPLMLGVFGVFADLLGAW